MSGNKLMISDSQTHKIIWIEKRNEEYYSAKIWCSDLKDISM